MFKFIPQYKGKDLNKVVSSAMKSTYYSGIKFDGNYIQIHKFGNEVMLFTSGGKPFRLKDLEEEIVFLNISYDFIIETEYIGITSGKLGSRGQCTTTTWRTNYSKGFDNYAKGAHFKVFDLLYLSDSATVYHDCVKYQKDFKGRLELLESLAFNTNLSLVQFDEMPLEEAKKFSERLCEQGYEGTFNFHSSHIYRDKGRSNLGIKIKDLPTADLLCIGVKYSDINPEDIGSIICTDKSGRQVAVAGLRHELKGKEPSYFISRVIEVYYESMGVNTYVQPRFKCFRDDKTIGGF